MFCLLIPACHADVGTGRVTKKRSKFLNDAQKSNLHNPQSSTKQETDKFHMPGTLVLYHRDKLQQQLLAQALYVILNILNKFCGTRKAIPVHHMEVSVLYPEPDSGLGMDLILLGTVK